MVKMVQAKVSYDSEEDSLFLYRSGVRSKGSVIAGNFILDLSHKGTVKGIEIMKATKTLSIVEDRKIPKEFFKHIQKANIRTKIENNIVYGVFSLVSLVERKKEVVDSYVQIPLMATG